MSDGDLPVVYWPEVMRPALEAAPNFEAEWPGYTQMLKSRALFNAVYTEHATTLLAVRERIHHIIWLLIWIRNEQRNGTPDVKKLTALIERKREQAKANIKDAVKLAWKLPDPYQQQQFAIATEMQLNMLLPPQFKTHGAAAASNESAWAGGCAREFDALLSPEAVNRYATIAELLGFVGISRSPQLIRSLLKAGKT